MPTLRSIPPPVNSAVKFAKQDDGHRHRRRFIGPLPGRVIPWDNAAQQSPGKVKPGSTLPNGNSHDHVDGVIRSLALDFFLGHGGTREEWGETEERHVREEMYRIWAESEWGKAHRQRKEGRTDRRWVGTSFDVGVFLGVDILEGGPRSEGPSRNHCDSLASSSRHAASNPAADTFVTVPSHFPSSPTAQAPTNDHLGRDVRLAPQLTREEDEHSAANSSTALIRSSTRAESHQNFSTTALHGSTRPNGTVSKGKGKAVHYSDSPVDEQPSSPAEVLTRTGSAVEGTSAGAAERAKAAHQPAWNDVVMRDRILVKFSHSESATLPADFDEWANRTTSHLYNKDWKEYDVVWRKDRLELYKNHRLPGQDWLTGHQKLTFVVPLNTSLTKLSLYSFVDLTFCLICPPGRLRDGSRQRWLYSRSSGLNVFVFKVKSRSRATDWVWKLWTHLSGELPPFLEILSPTLDMRIKIDMPPTANTNTEVAFTVFNHHNVLRLCEERLREVDGYDALIGQKVAAGTKLELAWRCETNLDWVWQLDDVQGNPREWAALCGLALNQRGKPAHLEVRLKEHFPTHLRLKDGTRLDEPPAVEGYLERIRPNTQLKQPLYLTTHDGYLFALNPASAHHPPPPGSVSPESNPESLREDEVRRGMRQIMHATGMTDLRSVVAVRRAFQLIPRHAEGSLGQDTPDWEDADGFWDDVERTESDDEDKGGNVGLSIALDRPRLRMRRSFELLMKTGHVVRFEAYSCHHALEWIVRLRPLVSYWRKRHQVDARREMDLAHVSTGRPRITPLTHVHEELDAAPEPPPDPQGSLPELSSFFNWCIMENCRPLVKCGKLYARSGLRGQYKHVQLVLVTGALIHFRITDRRSLHHRRTHAISLLDACVCSGYLAAQYLPQREYDPDAPHVARRYQDGLETDDGPEDTLFMIWHQTSKKNMPAGTSGDNSMKAEPKLSQKRKLSVFQTRSKLERDAWVWAINAEIEKIVRNARDREERIRQAGSIINF